MPEWSLRTGTGSGVFFLLSKVRSLCATGLEFCLKGLILCPEGFISSKLPGSNDNIALGTISVLMT